jgi:hypothetical protein
MSAGQSLSAHLLSNLPEHEDDERDADDYEEGGMPCSPKIVVSNEALNKVSGDASSQPSWWNENGVAWVVLPALLFLQFGAVFCMMSGAEATMTGLRWSDLGYGIVLFFGIIILYHKSIEDCKPTCTAVLIAPEILINIISGLVILDQLVAAFLFMLGSILSLAILVAVIRIQFRSRRRLQAAVQDKLDGS